MRGRTLETPTTRAGMDQLSWYTQETHRDLLMQRKYTL